MTEAQGDNKRIAKNTFFLYMRMILTLLVSLYTTRIVLNVLGVLDYGIYNVVAGFVSMFTFLNTSMMNAVQRFYNFEKGKNNNHALSKIFSSAIIIQLSLGLCLLLILETFGLWYINNKMTIPTDKLFSANVVFQFSVGSLFFVMLQIPYSSAVLAYEKMDFYAIVSIIDVLLKLVMVISLQYINCDKLIVYGSIIFIVSIIDFLCYYIYAVKNLPTLNFSKKIDVKAIRAISTFSGWNLLEAIAYIFKGQGLNVLINAFFTAVVNAAYGVANQVSAAIQAFSMNVMLAFKPQLTEAYAQSNLRRVTILMHFLSKVSYALLLTLCIPVIFNLNYILKIWLGEDVPQYTTIFTILVLVNMILSSLNTPLSYVVQATGQVKSYQIVRSIVIIATFPLSWLGLKMGYAPQTVFWVSIVTTVINQIVSLYLIKRIYPFDYHVYMKDVISPCVLYSVLCITPSLLLFRYMSSGVYRLISIALLSSISSGIVFLHILLNKREREIAKSFIPSKLKNIL